MGSYVNAFINVNPSLSVLMGVRYGMIPNTVFSLGTERHMDLLTKLRDGQVSTYY